MSQHIPVQPGAPAAGRGITHLLAGLSDASSRGPIIEQLVSMVGQLEPSSRLLIAERLVAYAGDVLVRPLSPLGARVLDGAGAQLRGLRCVATPAPANDNR